MHVLYVHRNFPAQFGHIAARLVRDGEHRATFVSEKPPGTAAGVELIQYAAAGGATERTHPLARNFESAVWHASAVHDALEPLAGDLKPDLIVGHSGFGSTLFLHDLFPGVPVVNLFEWFYRATDSDLDFRPDRPPRREDVLRSRTRNGMILLDLHYATAGYCPTEFQRSFFPEGYGEKLETIHDGIDTEFWRPREAPKALGELQLGVGDRLMTYVSRGLESIRGFDVFMKVAKKVTDADPRVRVVIVGANRDAYSGDAGFTGTESFRDWVLAQDEYDLSRIHFSDPVPPETLAQLLSMSDLHIFLTAPFVLSWSPLNAMACGATVLASDTSPVREVIRHGENGLLCDFFDADGMAALALEVLDEPDRFEHLGRAARRTIEERYSLDVTFPRMLELYKRAVAS